ncbi:conserved hypothetical protein [Vibrio coralliirubri]|uniref:Uncharacterized protein n=1 Tax=Vibrio coralliirubri TaxID=1516159 RepID=A0AA86X9J5_9VIBR|nr:conserved hypothetical protein [Vibrio coralliirubri]
METNLVGCPFIVPKFRIIHLSFMLNSHNARVQYREVRATLAWFKVLNWFR